MNNIYLTHAPTFPREFGRGTEEGYFTRDFVDKEAFFWKIRQYNGKMNIYVTVYAFESDLRLSKKEGKYSKPIIDTIFIDLDINKEEEQTIYDVYQDLVKLNISLHFNAITPRIYFSGRKGFHVFLDFERTDLVCPKETIKSFITKLIIGLDLKNVDSAVLGDIARVSRIPNSLHLGSGKYCIPLELLDISRDNSEDLRTMEKRLNRILDLSKKPRDIEIVRNPSPYVRKLLLKIDKQFTEKPKTLFDIRYAGCRQTGGIKAFRPCINKIYLSRNERDNWHHSERLALAWECSFAKIEIEEAVKFYYNMDDIGDGSEKGKITRKFLKDVYVNLGEHSRNKRIPCKQLFDWGICDPNVCKSSAKKIKEWFGESIPKRDVKNPTRKKVDKDIKKMTSRTSTIFKFNKVGDSIEGFLIDKKKSKYDNFEYVLETEDGIRVIYGTTQIDKDLKDTEFNSPVKIVYMGNIELKNGREMKDFTIYSGVVKSD